MEALQERSAITSQLYADPHNPYLHLERGLIHEHLGFPDLASADAYRALSLLDSVVDPEGCEFHAQRKIQTPALTPAPAPEAEDEHEGGEDDDEDDNGAYAPITEDEYNAMIGSVYALLVRSLVRCDCLRDAYEFALRGVRLLEEISMSQSLSMSPDEDEVPAAKAKRALKDQIALIRKKYFASKKTTDDGGEINPNALNAQGFAPRVLYPWNTHEPDRTSPETLRLLNERLKDVAPKCEVRAVALPALQMQNTNDPAGRDSQNDNKVSIQLGLFAKEDFAPGETVLHESSLLTATNRLHDDLCDACNGPLPPLSSEEPAVACADCDDTIFCSQTCHDNAQETYHAAVCGLSDRLDSIGKDIPDPEDKADYLYLLLLGRAIAMSATQDTHPLDLDQIKFIWGCFHPSPSLPSLPDNNNTDQEPAEKQSLAKKEGWTLPFSLHLNVLQPMRIIEEMTLDPYVTLPRYDTWVLNTLYAKFRGTASGRLSAWDGGPELCAVHPFWALANHSCDPNVCWEWGGEISFRARVEAERAVWRRDGKGSGDEEVVGGLRGGEGGGGGVRKGSGGIRKGEEILNHYCDVGLGVRERRELARGTLDGVCVCERCVWEAEEVV